MEGYWVIPRYQAHHRKGHQVQLQVDSIDLGIVPVCMGLCIWGLEFWPSDILQTLVPPFFQ